MNSALFSSPVKCIINDTSFLNNYLQGSLTYGAGFSFSKNADPSYEAFINISNSVFENNLINETKGTGIYDQGRGAGLCIVGVTTTNITNTKFINNKFTGLLSACFGEAMYIYEGNKVYCENNSYINDSIYNLGDTTSHSTSGINANLILNDCIFSNATIINDGVIEIIPINNFTYLQFLFDIIKSQTKKGINAGILVLNYNIFKSDEEKSSFKYGVSISHDIQLDGNSTIINANDFGSHFTIDEEVTVSFRGIILTNNEINNYKIINNGDVAFGNVNNFTALDESIKSINNGTLILLNNVVKTGDELSYYRDGINVTHKLIIDGQGKYNIDPVSGEIFNDTKHYVSFNNYVFNFNGDNFTSLNNTIINLNSGKGNILNIKSDITKQPEEYDIFKDGVIISSSAIINGNNHIINAPDGLIFTVDPNCDLDLKSIKLNNTGIAINNSGRVIMHIASSKLTTTFIGDGKKILNNNNDSVVRIQESCNINVLVNLMNIVDYGNNIFNIEYYSFTNPSTVLENPILINDNVHFIGFSSYPQITYSKDKFLFNVTKDGCLMFSNVQAFPSKNFIYNEGTIIFDNSKGWKTTNGETIFGNGIIKVKTISFQNLEVLIKTVNNGNITLLSDINDTTTKQYIEIAKEVVIDGNGFTIDSNSKSAFKITSTGKVTLKNFVFVNSAKQAVINEGNLTLINCNFINNTYSDYGASIYNNKGNLIINDCTFTNSSGEKGGLIYTVGGKINYSNLHLEPNVIAIVLNNTSIESKIIAIALNNDTLNAKIGFEYDLNVSFADEFNNIVAILNNDAKILFNGVIKGNLNNTGVNSTYHFVPTSSETGIVISVSCPSLSNLEIKTGTLNVGVPISFSDLQKLIDANDVVELADDCYYIPANDSAYKDGLVINKSVVIRGNGFKLIASHIASFFNVTSGYTLTLENIDLVEENKTKIITNNGDIILNNVSLKGNISNNGTIKSYDIVDFNKLQFYINMVNGGELILAFNIKNNNTKVVNIDKNLIIEGNGLIINACNENYGSIFNITSGINVILKNMVLVNATNYAIINKGNLSVINITFENIISDDYGAAIYNNKGNLTVINANFKNCIGNKGGIIYTYDGLANLVNINVLSSKNIVIVSNGTNISSKVIAIVLNNSTTIAKVGVNSSLDVTFVDANNNIIAILDNGVNLLFNNTLIGNLTNAGNHSSFIYNPTEVNTYVVSVNYSKLSKLEVKTGFLIVKTSLSFTELQELINKNSIINLTDEVIFDPIKDSAYIKGLIINKTVTILGNGLFMDALKIAIFFNIKENGSLNLVNINLINASEIAIVNYGNLFLNNVSTKGRILNNGIISSEVIVNVYGGKLTTYDSFVVVLKNRNGNNIIVPKLIITDDQGHKYTSYIYYKGLYIFYVPEGITGHVTFNHSTVNGFTNVSSSGYLDISKYPQNNFKGVLNKVVKNTINSIKTVNLPNLVKNFDYNFQLILNFLR